MSAAPLFFVGHGSPMFAVDTGAAAKNLAEQRSLLESVAAIVVVSPHWLTQQTRVITNNKPQTIHDFGGFPEQLYQLQYLAPGSHTIGHEMIQLLQKNGVKAHADDVQGWDHGVWVPLLHLYPAADKPVIQISLNINMSMDELDKLGQVLNQLRQQNIAVICSGSVTHNLYEMSMSHTDVAEYVLEFQHWVRVNVLTANLEKLKKASTESGHYKRSHPTPEHFLPLIIALATSDESDKVKVLKSPVLHRTISMESYVWTRAY